MPEVDIDKKTRWECQKCGDCCNGIILSKDKSLSVMKDGHFLCKNIDFEKKICLKYSERPFICRLYPFILQVEKIMSELPGVHTIAGISNASYGLPARKVINRTYLGLMMAHGLDAALMDPLDPEMMAVVHTAEMLLDHDGFCENYLDRVRSGEIRG